MFDIGPDKIVVVAAIAFLLLGPDRIPSLARSLQKARGHVRELTRAVPPEALDMIREPRRALLDALGDAPKAIEGAFRVEPAREPGPQANPAAHPLPDDASLN
jgi:Sec-independent protein translocase protein TatA